MNTTTNVFLIKIMGCCRWQELDDVADEMIRRRSRQIITEHDYEKEG